MGSSPYNLVRYGIWKDYPTAVAYQNEGEQ
jgi:hypothetical protein